MTDEQQERERCRQAGRNQFGYRVDFSNYRASDPMSNTERWCLEGYYEAALEEKMKREKDHPDRTRWRECGARAASVGKHRWCGAVDRRKRSWWLEGYDDVVKANDPGVPVFSP